MKHSVVSFILVLFYFFGLAKDLTISGLIKNAVNQKIYLAIQKGNEPELIDSTATDANGNFGFTLKQGYKQGVYKFWLIKEKAAAIIIGREEKLNISADLAGLKEGVLHVNASKENDAYAVLTNFFALYSKELDSLGYLLSHVPRFDPQRDAKIKQIKANQANSIVRFNSSVRLIPEMFSGTFTSEVLCPLYIVAEKSESDAGKNYDTDEAFQHAHFFQHINFSDPRIVNTATYESKLFTYLDLYVEHTVEGFKKGVDNILTQAKKHNAIRDFTVAYLLKIFTKKGPPELVEYVHDNYSEGCEIPVNPDTEKLLSKLKQVSTGNPAPELVINDINYAPASMKNTLKGKLGMIYFWSSTCPQCMEHTPKVFEVYQKYKNKGFEVYSVSLDSDYAAWVKAVQDMKLEWVNVSELKGWNSDVINTYALERTPSVFLVDKEGNILDKNFAPSELEDKLKKYLP